MLNSGNRVALRQDYERPGILQHKRQSLTRISGIQRHIGRSSFEHGEDGNHHRYGTLDANGCRVLRANSRPPQIAGQLVCSSVQFPIGQLRLFKDHGNCIRRFFDLSLYQFVNAWILGIIPCRIIPPVDYLLLLHIRKNREFRNSPIGIRDDALQKHVIVTQHALDGGRIEQIRVVFHSSPSAVVGLDQMQG